MSFPYTCYMSATFLTGFFTISLLVLLSHHLGKHLICSKDLLREYTLWRIISCSDCIWKPSVYYWLGFVWWIQILRRTFTTCSR